MKRKESDFWDLTCKTLTKFESYELYKQSESEQCYLPYNDKRFSLRSSCRCVSRIAAGSRLRLALLQAALSPTAGPGLAQTDPSQRDRHGRAGAQVGQLQLPPASVERLQPEPSSHLCRYHWIAGSLEFVVFLIVGLEPSLVFLSIAGGDNFSVWSLCDSEWMNYQIIHGSSFKYSKRFIKKTFCIY